MTKPRIIFWDIETLPIVATTWTLWPKSLSHDNILQDWSIICAAWKDLEKDKVTSVSIKTAGDDYELCKKLREDLSTADVLVGHNADRFDLKKFNARLIYHKLPPLPLIPTIDTLKEVKKIAAFTSNRLDYLSKVLVGEGKIKTEYNLWLDVMKGNKRALKSMVEYCKVDVVRLQQVYEVLKPYMKTHVHVGVLKGEHRLESCPKCGSTKLKKNGIRVTASGIKRQECQCQSCGGYHRIPVVNI